MLTKKHNKDLKVQKTMNFALRIIKEYNQQIRQNHIRIEQARI